MIICFCSSVAEYVFQTPQYNQNDLAGVRLIMDYVDVDSDKWLQYSRYAVFPLSMIYRIEYKRLFKYEKYINKKFNCSVFVAEREMRLFKQRYPRAKHLHVVSNGVDLKYFRTYKLPREILADSAPALVFTGVMDYFANVDGVTWFARRILPEIRKAFPDSLFYIVGSSPTQAVRALTRYPGIRVTGFVDDIRDYYRMADICVIPLRIARGLQNKVLEAMASGKAVVATQNASEGIRCHPGKDIVIADGAAAFAKAVIWLLKNPEARKSIANNALINIQNYYNWKLNLEKLNKLIWDK